MWNGKRVAAATIVTVNLVVIVVVLIVSVAQTYICIQNGTVEPHHSFYTIQRAHTPERIGYGVVMVVAAANTSVSEMAHICSRTMYIN